MRYEPFQVSNIVPVYVLEYPVLWPKQWSVLPKPLALFSKHNVMKWIPKRSWLCPRPAFLGGWWRTSIEAINSGFLRCSAWIARSEVQLNSSEPAKRIRSGFEIREELYGRRGMRVLGYAMGVRWLSARQGRLVSSLIMKWWIASQNISRDIFLVKELWLGSSWLVVSLFVVIWLDGANRRLELEMKGWLWLVANGWRYLR